MTPEMRDRMDRETQALLSRNKDVIETGIWREVGSVDEYEEEADDDPKTEIAEILADPDHAYNNKKASRAEHEEAVTYMNQLIARKHRRG